MGAQKVEIFLPENEFIRLEEIVARHCRRFWREDVPGENEKLTCLVQQRYTARLLDELEDAFGTVPSLSVVVSRVEAAIPPVIEDADTVIPEPGRLRPRTALERWFSRDRLSTDELYDDVEESLRLRPSYLITVLLSSLIAGLGMRSGQVAVVIGAMVIAPLLGPTMGMAMAATVGDLKLGRRAAATLAVGTLVAIFAGMFVGWTVPIDATVAELRNRTLVQPADIALALACGAAGVLAFSRGTSLSLVGVMIAVALVPPLAACGIFLATGNNALAGGAAYLFMVNLVCVNVAGIATFLLQGLPPRSWRMTAGIFAVWAALLLLLASSLAGVLEFGIAS
ncbi:TIGR00341 family protein [Parerythrobacter aestuarii]|uniref:TIGR00341 family protein n=1 Tax=Parerythrobacter aestuarii TaxID=3020909 RepID=UPI0024DEDF60|nr:TIGR00341 family protein [Parerythrobacter aestuarii]